MPNSVRIVRNEDDTYATFLERDDRQPRALNGLTIHEALTEAVNHLDDQLLLEDEEILIVSSVEAVDDVDEEEDEDDQDNDQGAPPPDVAPQTAEPENEPDAAVSEPTASGSEEGDADADGPSGDAVVDEEPAPRRGRSPAAE